MAKQLVVIALVCFVSFSFSAARASTGNPLVDQVCPCTADWKNHGQYVSCVAKAVQSMVTKKMMGPIVSKAAKSSCGKKKEDSEVSIVIGPAGGTIALPHLATFTFPPGAFPQDTTVSIETTNDPLTEEAYKYSTAIFLAGERTEQEIRVRATALPIGTMTVQMNVPSDFLSKLPLNSEIQLFAQIYEKNDLELLDIFELMPSTFTPATGVINAQVPDVVFTNKRQPGLAEAIFVLGTTPTTPGVPTVTSQALASNRIDPEATKMGNKPEHVKRSPDIAGTSNTVLFPPALAALAAPVSCLGPCIDSPLSVDVTAPCIGSPVTNPPCIISDFEALRNRGNGREPHGGLDIATEVGTPVFAPYNGTVTRVATDPSGYGLFIVLAGPPGQTLYGHLSEALVTGGTVEKGTLIGKTGGEKGAPNSGSSQGPHLHFEYSPNGDLPAKKNRIDPLPCLKQCNVSFSFSDCCFYSLHAPNLLLLQVLRGGDTTGTVSVDYKITGQDAVEGIDYQLPLGPQTLIFNPGETQKDIPVQLLISARAPCTNLELTLVNPSHGSVMQDSSKAIITIYDTSNVSGTCQ